MDYKRFGRGGFQSYDKFGSHEVSQSVNYSEQNGNGGRGYGRGRGVRGNLGRHTNNSQKFKEFKTSTCFDDNHPMSSSGVGGSFFRYVLYPNLNLVSF